MESGVSSDVVTCKAMLNGYCQSGKIREADGLWEIMRRGDLCNEFMILLAGASSFKEAMKMGVEVYHHLKENKEGLELLKTAIEKAVLKFL
ncbi:hypothetical protein Droror1_Dr00001373 [Drosera rotundifolia]